MKRGSSTRLTGRRGRRWSSSSSSALRGRRVRPAPSRITAAASRIAAHDVVVARAAADVALDRVADLLVGGIRVARQQVGRGHDHARACRTRTGGRASPRTRSAADAARRRRRCPSIVVTLAPSAWTASIVQLFTAWPSTWTVHAPHWLVSQPTWVPVRPRSSRMHLDQEASGFDVELPVLAVDLSATCNSPTGETSFPPSTTGVATRGVRETPRPVPVPRGDWIVPPRRVGCNRVSHRVRGVLLGDVLAAARCGPICRLVEVPRVSAHGLPIHHRMGSGATRARSPRLQTGLRDHPHVIRRLRIHSAVNGRCQRHPGSPR